MEIERGRLVIDIGEYGIQNPLSDGYAPGEPRLELLPKEEFSTDRSDIGDPDKIEFEAEGVIADA
jgi:hypothetical protein